MSKLPQVSGKQLVNALKRIGFEKVSQKGSHIKLQRVVGTRRQVVIVPDHTVIRKGTLRNGIMKLIDLSVEELIKLL